MSTRSALALAELVGGLGFGEVKATGGSVPSLIHSLALPGWAATARTSPSPHSSAIARVSGARRRMISGGKHALSGCWGLKRSSSILLCLSVGIHGIAACTNASLRRRATLGPRRRQTKKSWSGEAHGIMRKSPALA